MSILQWDYALTPTADHWIFEFILSRKISEQFDKLLGEHFEFRQTLNYPALPIIQIYRAYEDKYARFHYFTFSSKEVIDRFIDQRALHQILYVRQSQNKAYPRCKAQLIACGPRNANKLIYCLPSIHINKRSPA